MAVWRASSQLVGPVTITGDATVTGDLTVSGSLNFGDVGTDVLTVAGYIQGSASGTTYVRIGNGTTTHSLAATNDLFVSGKLEVDGVAFFDSTATFVTPVLGTPTSGTLTNCTGYTVANLSGLGANVATFLGTPSSANLLAAVTDETGSGALVFANTPTLVTPVLGAATATSINFGGTSLANYVQGTFVPTVTLVGGAGNTVPVYSTNTGIYTRIGNVVYADVYLTGDGGAEGAGTGQYTLSLPITASSGNASGYVPIGLSINGVVALILLGEIAASATTLSLNYYNVGASVATFDGAAQNNATRTVRLRFSYRV